jgi:Helix-turn-helix domain
MSKSHAASLRDPRHVAHHAQVCAEILGSHIRSARLRDGRSLEKLAPSAGLTVAEWGAIEAGQLPMAWEQVLLLAMVLRLGRSWMPYLMRLWAKAWGNQ